MDSYKGIQKTVDFLEKVKNVYKITLTEAQKGLLTPIILDSKKSEKMRLLYRESVTKEQKYYTAHPFRYSYICNFKHKLFTGTTLIHIKMWEEFMLVNYGIKANFDEWEINKYELDVLNKHVKFFYTSLEKGASELIKTLVKNNKMCLGWKLPELINFKTI